MSTRVRSRTATRIRSAFRAIQRRFCSPVSEMAPGCSILERFWAGLSRDDLCGRWIWSRNRTRMTRIRRMGTDPEGSWTRTTGRCPWHDSEIGSVWIHLWRCGFGGADRNVSRWGRESACRGVSRCWAGRVFLPLGLGGGGLRGTGPRDLGPTRSSHSTARAGVDMETDFSLTTYPPTLQPLGARG